MGRQPVDARKRGVVAQRTSGVPAHGNSPMTEWHAVRAKIGAEGRALIGIEATGMGAYLPIELIRKNHRGEREIIWRPLFPRYL
jgi:hypothetical protein